MDPDLERQALPRHPSPSRRPVPPAGVVVKGAGGPVGVPLSGVKPRSSSLPTLRILVWMVVWYVSSLVNIIMIKVILSHAAELVPSDMYVLALVQMSTNTFFSGTFLVLFPAWCGAAAVREYHASSGSAAVRKPPPLSSPSGAPLHVPRKQVSRGAPTVALPGSPGAATTAAKETSSSAAAATGPLLHSGSPSSSSALRTPRKLVFGIVAMGMLRTLNIIFGLTGIGTVAVSFTEAVKSTAPLFTVGLALLILGERTSCRTLSSLLPVMLGLILTSMTEMSFNMAGFVATIINTFLECIQNVVCKTLCGRWTAPQVQFYTSVVASTMQIPMLLWASDSSLLTSTGLQSPIWWVILGDGFMYHLQWLSNFMVMDLVSPLTLSVSNTFKRGLIIMFSIFYFQNHVSASNYCGMGLMFLGVVLYTFSKQRDGDSPAASKAADTRDT